MASTIPALKLNNITLDELTARVGITGNATSSDKLKTPRNISLAGDISGNVDFDGSSDVIINTIVETFAGIDFNNFGTVQDFIDALDAELV